MTFKNLEHLQVSVSKCLSSKCFRNKIWNQITLALSPLGFFFSNLACFKMITSVKIWLFLVKIALIFLKPTTFSQCFLLLSCENLPQKGTSSFF